MTAFGNDMRSLSGDSAIRKNVVVWVCGDDTKMEARINQTH